MASSLYLIVVLCLTGGLWAGADAKCGKKLGWYYFRFLTAAEVEILKIPVGQLLDVGVSIKQTFLRDKWPVCFALKNCCKICPAGWTQVGSRCFMFHFTEKDWADAELNCIALGGNLASIRTADDYAILREMANRAAGRDKATWLGGFDAVKEGVWAWSDGSTFEFTAWAKDEPNNHGSGEHCMEMNFEERDYVNDKGCNERRSFICAKDAEYDL